MRVKTGSLQSTGLLAVAKFQTHNKVTEGLHSAESLKGIHYFLS
jgi:hypothetical protein